MSGNASVTIDASARARPAPRASTTARRVTSQVCAARVSGLMMLTRIARLLVLAATITLIAAPQAWAATGAAPGAPGERALWTPGNKDGFGTSTTASSKLWHTLNGGEL